MGIARNMLVGLAIALAVSAPSLAPAQEQPDHAAAVNRAIDRVIVPGYASFAEAASAQAASMTRLCTEASEDALSEAQAAFAKLVTAFSPVELYRFGPARAENRFERLFFWPDRRGRGLRQVQRLISSEDPTALDGAALAAKSVAVQGLLALDFVLSGTGSDSLVSGPSGYRCRYGTAIADAIRKTAEETRDGWTSPSGYANVMRGAGPGNAVYRSHAEAIQELLQAAREQIQIVRDLKLVALVGDSQRPAKPKTVPFWRSGLALNAILANIEGVMTLLEEGGLRELLPDDRKSLTNELAFELRQAHRAISDQSRTGSDVTKIVPDSEAHHRLSYAAIPLGGAFSILSERLPQALGLSLGFNSLDGD